VLLSYFFKIPFVDVNLVVNIVEDSFTEFLEEYHIINIRRLLFILPDPHYLAEKPGPYIIDFNVGT
jgi:hypothetical protein